MTQELTYNAGYINILVTHQLARELVKAGAQPSHYTRVELIAAQPTKDHCIVWDIVQDHLWYLNVHDSNYHQVSDDLIKELRLLPTPESRVEYFTSK